MFDDALSFRQNVSTT